MFGLFLPTSGQLLTPNPASHIVTNHVQYFHFIGKMLGKALYEVAIILLLIPLMQYYCTILNIYILLMCSVARIARE